MPGPHSALEPRLLGLAQVLYNVTGSVSPGELLALMGPSGEWVAQKQGPAVAGGLLTRCSKPPFRGLRWGLLCSSRGA